MGKMPMPQCLNRMKILLVNHTFPPESYAGSELCVLHLAKAFQRQGHEVFVFYRYQQPADEEYQVRRGEWEGIPVFKINRTFRLVRRFQEIYLDSAVAARFGTLLREIQPDIVHFHHLTNLSLSLVQECKGYGCPVVMTLHDYWLLCQRGQLLKADLTLCHGPSDGACRSCLAVPLLRGPAQAWAVRLSRWGISRDQPHVVMDLLNQKPFRVQAPQADFVSPGRFDLGERSHAVLIMHPPAEVSFRMRLNVPCRLQTAVALHPSTYGQEGGGVRFEVWRSGERLIQEDLDPKREPSHRDWRLVELDLDPSPGEDELVLKTQAIPEQDNRFCTAGWREPVIVRRGGSGGDVRTERPALNRLAGRLAGWMAWGSSTAREGIAHRRNWVKRVWEDVDLFISPSRYLRDFFVRHGLSEEKIIFSDNGFVHPAPGVRRSAALPLRFGYIGTWIPSKGVDLAIRAFQKIDPARAKLLVYGFFPGYDGYERYEETLRLLAGSAVEMRGRYEPGEVFALLAEMDVLVMPSIWWENSPLTLHEAFLAGVPVITADVGGMAEQVADGGGITFRHRDWQDLRRVIQELVEYPARLETMRASIPQVKSVEEHAAELMAWYNRLLEKKTLGTHGG